MFTRIHFQDIGVTDMARALAFYTDKFGFEVERDMTNGNFRWIFLRIPGADTLLHFDKRPVIENTTTPVLILAADDTDATCATLEARGVAILEGPADAPWEPGTRWAQIRDTEGNIVFIQSHKGNPSHG